MLRIIDIDWHIEYAEFNMRIGQPFETAFKKKETESFSFSADALKHSLNWMWLQMHKGTSFEHVSEVVADITKRSLRTYEVAVRTLNREVHHYLMICSAILSGNDELIATVAEAIPEDGLESEQPIYFQALANTLKLAYLGDPARAAQHLARFLECKGKPTGIPVPKGTVLKALLENDPKPIQRYAGRVAEDFWTRLALLTGSAPQKPQADFKFGMRWDYNHFWPWPAATVLRSMVRRGATFKTDGFWFPPQLITGSC